MYSSKPHQDADTNAMKKDEQNRQYIFNPRAFNIVWGNDNRYWRILPAQTPSSSSSSSSSRNNSGEDEVAELRQVSWLEVTGTVNLWPSKKYQISFTLSFKGDAFGWNGSPVFLMAKVGKKGRYKWKRLMELEKQPTEATEVPNEPFIIEAPKDQLDTRLFFGLYEVWSGKWKGGLRIHYATVKAVN